MEEETSLSNAATSSLPLTNIYLCHLCDKPYVSESSRQRHLRYCGSRVRKRPRSCRACNAAKTKCSFDTPCSRCMKKGIECSYVVSPKEGSRALPTTSRSDEVVMSLADVASVDREPVDNDIFVQSFEINGSLQADLSMQPFIFDEPFNIDGFTVLQDYITNPPPCLPDNSLAHLSKLDQKAPSWCTWSRGGVSTLLVMSDTSIVERDSEMNMFAMIKTYKPHAQHNANLIIQALRALPTMMLRRNTFPWFIHSHAHLLSNPPKTSLPEALSTCMSISHMFASRMPETRPFLWCTIRAEYRRFINEMYNMSQYELLAAIQACMVYLIMCIVDQSPESEQNSLELLMAIHNLYVLFKEVGTGWTRLSELSHPSSNWEEWIFAESQRRPTDLRISGFS
ncbi:hypothetical protein BDV96DRAFT_2257 [Lophiotrema nucula]|uniref:Zn(2)-C6 fungal-type domain-containing protein n=1 Tax=Lophiotrema nucula TaxID=690887 RepID=A0A6A5ZW10_9PLEO|nr:hypothetical protein BDV96DRAFT_2257 [Lophiotrema nucula]